MSRRKKIRIIRKIFTNTITERSSVGHGRHYRQNKAQKDISIVGKPRALWNNNKYSQDTSDKIKVF